MLKKSGSKGRLLCFMVIAIVSVIMTACSSGESSGTAEEGRANQEVYQFEFNNVSSSLSSTTKDVILPWVEMVEEKTDGRVKINVHHGGALGKIGTVYQDVSNGVYDMATMYSQSVEETENHLITVGDLPFIATNDIEIDSKVMTEFYNRHKDEVLNGVEVMGVTTGGLTNMLSSKPIETIEDFKGLTIRAGADSESAIYFDWGMTPVEVAPEERYDALQRGIITAMGTAKSVAVDSRYYEVVDYYYELPYKTMHVFAIVNENRFQSLPEDLQQLFREELFPAYQELKVRETIIQEDVYLEQLKDEINVSVFPEEELEKLKDITTSSEAAWIDNANKRGLDGEGLLEEYREIQKELAAQ
ncbi:TRAP transporter substrate-binding protein [Halalkalibacter krulwichiae]|uniref:Lactate-binding periplasmic protein n=1 Tax=Halalkalibacter krulwichiae TaxID=199441 RepID=A0A1X9MHG9_9BACI|nr:TRAP transporter substrate-binding protein DctP [Halalkalibacter krulwichiae]ARK29882.1 Lactate-binding periplasmic protein precursor [Halalkalibacter krulwichiae]